MVENLSVRQVAVDVEVSSTRTAELCATAGDKLKRAMEVNAAFSRIKRSPSPGRSEESLAASSHFSKAKELASTKPSAEEAPQPQEESATVKDLVDIQRRLGRFAKGRKTDNGKVVVELDYEMALAAIKESASNLRMMQAFDEKDWASMSGSIRSDIHRDVANLLEELGHALAAQQKNKG